MLHRVSPYRVEVDSIASLYSHDFFSTQCGLIRDMFHKTKEDIYYALFEVDEIMCNYEKVIEKTDPRVLIEAFRDTLAVVTPSGGPIQDVHMMRLKTLSNLNMD